MGIYKSNEPSYKLPNQGWAKSFADYYRMQLLTGRIAEPHCWAEILDLQHYRRINYGPKMKLVLARQVKDPFIFIYWKN